ncbi:MAG: L-aspartate oxidase [Desulfotomaculaceae bacterium]
MDRRYRVIFNTRELLNEYYDIIIIGSGIAGLYAAYKAGNKGYSVALITKKALKDSNTDKAQGGIAAALEVSDSPKLHLQDTLQAGAGLCDKEAVSILVNEGALRVRELIELGVEFDRHKGTIDLTREGAHSHNRILHAHGDATGAEIQRTLSGVIISSGKVEIFEEHFVIDILVKNDRCYGALVYDSDGKLKVFRSYSVVLATGGLGRLYSLSTNPEVATGDGVAIAYRAGAEVMDMEFVQFHPTTLAHEGAPGFLISEAVRGEGAYLVGNNGERFMPRYHELAELGPRDIVARAIISEMSAENSDHVFLTVQHLPEEVVKIRFPNIVRTCLECGLDITGEPIPVAPAAHYMMGGVRTDLNGRTSINGLYACGEVACQGVHGANRLASNSLLDGLVYGCRAINRIAHGFKRRKHENIDFRCVVAKNSDKNPDIDFKELRRRIQQVITLNVGPVRNETGLTAALSFFEQWTDLPVLAEADVSSLETCNMLTVGELVAHAALMRKESRGGHYREDFPVQNKLWRKHIIMRKCL